MDLLLSAEQELLVEAARGFLASRCPLSEVRRLAEDPKGYDPKCWREMAELGWLGLELPEPVGGSGQGFVETVLLLEEMGRALLPSPYVASSVVAADLVAELGDTAQRAHWLPRLASGEVVASPALAEPGWRGPAGEPAAEAREARATGGGAAPGADADAALEITGSKTFAPYAAQADLLLVSVAGPGLALVRRGAPGLSLRRQAAGVGPPVYELRLDGTPAERLGGPAAASDPEAGASAVRAALARALDRGALASLADATGAAERALEMSVEYAKARHQFGRPIGSFQAVAHRLVDVRSDVDALRHLIYQAAWCLTDDGRDAGLEVGAAHAYGVDALRRIFRHAHQVHGAIGFSTEHDLHLFTRRAKAAELGWGTAAASRERVAAGMGL